MATADVARLEAKRMEIDEDLGALTQEQEQLETLVVEIERRRQRLDNQWKRLIAERDRVDEQLWSLLVRPEPSAEIAVARTGCRIARPVVRPAPLAS